MGQTIQWTVTAPGIDKALGLALALEFWTGQGFVEHSSSYNRVVLRRKHFGTVRSWLVSTFGGELTWANAPIQLTVLVQAMPDQLKYSLEFELGAGHTDKEGDDLVERCYYREGSKTCKSVFRLGKK